MITKMTRTLVAGALGLALAGAAAPAAVAAPPASIEVTKEAKLVKGGAAAMIEGTYDCKGDTAVDVLVDVDQKSDKGSAQGKGKGQGLQCSAAERAAGKKKWKVTVPVQSRGGLFVAASAYVSVRLCGTGTLNVFASLNLWVNLRF
ncbi:hypothetical protein [Allokutzneria albata]|uniref:Neocarzinostatin family protein n=1 Tax=Allokutzneria albata TaxID=211114 RepID=A0A1G9WSX0_ALLAB|nr:hypothetical protein [Allokutzneria albata]SDM87479.1 hypothetical protein SAMN04489726_3788 [Allokutzneria albata]